MPYIKRAHRPLFEEPIQKIGNYLDTPGDLNYAITKLAIEYLHRHGRSYTTLNAIEGAFQCASKEFYRRVTAPYETTKIVENGDVYPGSAAQ
jgi:hypothetical protein